MEIKSFDELTGREAYQILKARSEIFMIEQGIRVLDMDEVDYDAIHIFERDERGVTAYLRMYDAERVDSCRIGRVLTRDRRQGNGLRLLLAAEECARQRGKRLLKCDAQLQSRGFYEKAGFTAVSGEFIEAGIPHIRMEKMIRMVQ